MPVRTVPARWPARPPFGRSRRSAADPATRRSGSRPAGPGGRRGRRTARPRWRWTTSATTLRAEAWGPGRRARPRRRPGAARARPGRRRRSPAPPGRRIGSPAGSPASGSRGRGAVLEALVPAILEQKVTGEEARRALVRARPASTASRRPARRSCGLRLPPAPATLAALPYYAYHPFGVERRRADLIRRVAARAAWFEAIVGPAARRGVRPADGRSGDRAVDGRRGRRPGARRRRRGERRRLPPAEPRGVRAGRRAARRPTPGCSSCSSRTAASARGSSGSLELSGIRVPRYGPRLAFRRIEES